MTISVVIPCNNVESFIGSTVRSVLSQTLSPTQIICVDDGSTDGTRDILRDFEAKGAPLTVISQVNQGSNVARNVGLEHVEGEYTQFLDADDILHPEKLEHQAHLIASQDTKPDFVAAAYEKLPVDEAYEGIKGAVGINEDPWSGLILITLGITSANLWKTAAVRSVGGWNPSYSKSQEYELMFRLLKNDASVLHDEEGGTIIRKRHNSISNENRAESRRVALRLLQEIKIFLQSQGLLTPERARHLHNMSFLKIYQLYPDDPTYAHRAHGALIPATYTPRNDAYDLGIVYEWVYQTLGLPAAQHIHPAWLWIRSKWPR